MEDEGLRVHSWLSDQFSFTALPKLTHTHAHSLSADTASSDSLASLLSVPPTSAAIRADSPLLGFDPVPGSPDPLHYPSPDYVRELSLDPDYSVKAPSLDPVDEDCPLPFTYAYPRSRSHSAASSTYLSFLASSPPPPPPPPPSASRRQSRLPSFSSTLSIPSCFDPDPDADPSSPQPLPPAVIPALHKRASALSVRKQTSALSLRRSPADLSLSSLALSQHIPSPRSTALSLSGIPTPDSVRNAVYIDHEDVGQRLGALLLAAASPDDPQHPRDSSFASPSRPTPISLHPSSSQIYIGTQEATTSQVYLGPPSPAVPSSPVTAAAFPSPPAAAPFPWSPPSSPSSVRHHPYPYIHVQEHGDGEAYDEHDDDPYDQDGGLAPPTCSRWSLTSSVDAANVPAKSAEKEKSAKEREKDEKRKDREAERREGGSGKGDKDKMGKRKRLVSFIAARFGVSPTTTPTASVPPSPALHTRFEPPPPGAKTAPVSSEPSPATSTVAVHAHTHAVPAPTTSDVDSAPASPSTYQHQYHYHQQQHHQQQNQQQHRHERFVFPAADAVAVSQKALPPSPTRAPPPVPAPSTSSSSPSPPTPPPKSDVSVPAPASASASASPPRPRVRPSISTNASAGAGADTGAGAESPPRVSFVRTTARLSALDAFELGAGAPTPASATSSAPSTSPISNDAPLSVSPRSSSSSSDDDGEDTGEDREGDGDSDYTYAYAFTSDVEHTAPSTPATPASDTVLMTGSGGGAGAGGVGGAASREVLGGDAECLSGVRGEGVNAGVNALPPLARPRLWLQTQTQCESEAVENPVSPVQHQEHQEHQQHQHEQHQHQQQDQQHPPQPQKKRSRRSMGIRGLAVRMGLAAPPPVPALWAHYHQQLQEPGSGGGGAPPSYLPELYPDVNTGASVDTNTNADTDINPGPLPTSLLTSTSTSSMSMSGRLSISSRRRPKQKRRRLVISGLREGDEGGYEAVRRWCEGFGEVREMTRKRRVGAVSSGVGGVGAGGFNGAGAAGGLGEANGVVVVDFRKASVAETVCRVQAQVHIKGAGSVNLSWCTGK